MCHFFNFFFSLYLPSQQSHTYIFHQLTGSSPRHLMLPHSQLQEGLLEGVAVELPQQVLWRILRQELTVAEKSDLGTRIYVMRIESKVVMIRFIMFWPNYQPTSKVCSGFSIRLYFFCFLPKILGRSFFI